jgi:hypothetical protein
VTTVDHPTPQRAALELQALARDRALAERVDRLERVVARLHARIDGAMVTVLRERRSGSGAASSRSAP